jgi:hypothetical protein
MQRPIFYFFVAGFCAVVLAGIYGSSLFPAGAGLLLLFLVVAVLVIRRGIHIFYLLCTGVPAAFVVASVSLVFGSVAALLLPGIMAASSGETGTRMGKIIFCAFSVVFLVLCIPVLKISHVLPGLSALAVLAVIGIFLLLIAEYRIKIRYREKET